MAGLVELPSTHTKLNFPGVRMIRPGFNIIRAFAQKIILAGHMANPHNKMLTLEIAI
jgi:hypothetical protein